MGIRGVWKLLSGREIEYEELEHKTLCVDGNLVFFGCLGSESTRFVTEYALQVVGKLLSLGVDPIIVFDGRRPGFKRQHRIESGEGLKDSMCAPEPFVHEEPEEWPEPFPHREGWARIKDLYQTQVPKEKLRDLSMEAFSEMQINRIVERHKLFALSKHRMHGDTSLEYELTRKQSKWKACQESPSEAEYHKTEDEISALTDLLLGIPGGTKDTHGTFFPKKANSSASTPASTPASTSASTSASTLQTKQSSSLASQKQTVVLSCTEEKTEYQREKERYALDKAESLLNTEGTAKHSLSLSLKIILDVLDMLCLKYVLSPAESDSVYASLEEALDTDGVITEDSDILLFSTKTVYRHLFKHTKRPQAYSCGSANASVPYTWTELLLFAWMLGSDYSAGIRGIGLQKSTKLVLLYRSLLKDKHLSDMKEDKHVDTECLLKAFSEVMPEADISVYLPDLFRLKRIYTSTQFKVRVENLEPRAVDSSVLSMFLVKRTSWREAEGKEFIKLVEKAALSKQNHLKTRSAVHSSSTSNRPSTTPPQSQSPQKTP
ncbi:hypothetical protein NECID01_0228 [Nematocida sp. AWRm77]|nr:hypothetical protein NECID01_0228 [Nematocida sp. AWRm77]